MTHKRPLALLLLTLGATALATLAAPAATSAPSASGRSGWQPVPIQSEQNFRGLAAVSRKKAWVAGSGGEIWRTANGGKTWLNVSPPGAEALEFRDIEVHGRHRVSALAIGEGEQNQIFRSTDNGATWTRTFISDEPTSFYDCMAFFPGGRVGLAVSDPVEGQMRMIRTTDAGRTWQQVPPEGFPAPVDGEFYFAASGTCLVTVGGHTAYLGSGGGAARIFASRDRGRTWTVAESTLPASDAGGVFSLAFRAPRKGIAVGGDFLNETVGVDFSASTRDGREWRNAGDLGGYRSGVAWLGHGRWFVAVGPTGTDITRNDGRSWRTIDTVRYDAVDCTARGACWASGPAGAAARARLR
ncbi:MAG: oxidoreductase [Nocardioides sp.]